MMVVFATMQQFIKGEYLAKLGLRAKNARITQQFQLIGLEIATVLKDMTHKALYMKYAKEFGANKMLALAKDVAERRDVKNPAAYFMKMVKQRRTGDR